MKKKYIILTAIIVCSILTFNLWMVLPFSIFYKGLAVTMLLSALLIRIDSEKGTNYRYLCDLWLLLTANNIVDEFFFNPKAMELNEYLFGFVILAHAAYKHRKNGKLEKRNN